MSIIWLAVNFGLSQIHLLVSFVSGGGYHQKWYNLNTVITLIFVCKNFRKIFIFVHWTSVLVPRYEVCQSTHSFFVRLLCSSFQYKYFYNMIKTHCQVQISAMLHDLPKFAQPTIFNLFTRFFF